MNWTAIQDEHVARALAEHEIRLEQHRRELQVLEYRLSQRLAALEALYLALVETVNAQSSRATTACSGERENTLGVKMN